jgi:tetratricopeptide (TPR) repeat protein
MSLLLVALLAAGPPVETAAAREQARRCETVPGDEGLLACRSALSLGLAPARFGPVRELLARHLVSAQRWEELAAHFAEDVARHPDSADARFRLGSTLLFALGRVQEALGPLAEAAQLDPASVDRQVTYGLALSAAGRPQEALAAFEEALRRDPEALASRPAAAAVREAARRGEGWPR